MPHQAARLQAPLPKPASFWLGTLLSALVGFSLYAATATSIENDERQRFANHARHAQLTIGTRVKSYTDVLRGTASLFQSNEMLTGDQFHEYVSGLDLPAHFPAIATMNFARYIEERDRATFEARMRGGLERATAPTPDFKIVPPGRRDAYSVLTFIEPRELWTSKLGLDIQFPPHVAAALSASRDSGIMVTSGLPIQAMSGPSRTGLGMRLPIYRPGMPLTSVAERRAAYLGSVGIAFSVHQLVLGVLDELPIRGVRLVLVDHGAAGLSSPGRTIFDSSANDARVLPTVPPQDANHFSIALPVDFNGRTWAANLSVSRGAMSTGINEYFPWLALLAGFVSSMLLYALFHTLASSRRRAVLMAKDMTKELRASQDELQASHHQLRRLAAHAEKIKEGERKRIAREIHDDLGQNLLALRIEVDMLASRTRDTHPRLHARARGTLSQIDTTIKSVRQIINDLRPTVLDLGLSAAVEWQVSEFRRRTGIPCELIDNHKEIGMSDHCATALFRILQESLSNISRHARATEARVELTMRDGCLAMSISDNGVGFSDGGRNKVGSFGLVGIEERVHLLSGSCSVSGHPGAGTVLQVIVPIHNNENGAPSAPDASAIGAMGAEFV